MARRILVSFILFLTLAFSVNYSYEVIRNMHNDIPIVTVYLNDIEVFSFLQEGTSGLSRAYSFLSQISMCLQAGMDPRKIKIEKLKDKQMIKWDKEIITQITLEEFILNKEKGTSVNKLRKVLSGFKSSSYLEYSLDQFKNNISNSSLKSFMVKEVSALKANKYLPIVHSILSVGTKVRLHNPLNDWTVIAEVVDQIAISVDQIGLDKEGIKALGIKTNDRVKLEIVN